MRRLALTAAVAAAAALPFAQPASAVCQSVHVKTTASAGYCDEYGSSWSWCAGTEVSGVGGVGACRPTNGAGVWVGCWTFQGLHCN